MFYRHPSADMLWRPDDVDANYARSTRIFHYGSISLIGEPSRSATLAALGYARAGGAMVSYDPQPAPGSLALGQAAWAGMLSGWGQADVAKINDEELVFLTGETDLERGARQVVARPAAPADGDLRRAGLPLLHP